MNGAVDFHEMLYLFHYVLRPLAKWKQHLSLIEAYLTPETLEVTPERTG